eukprot:gene9203-16877_t
MAMQQAMDSEKSLELKLQEEIAIIRKKLVNGRKQKDILKRRLEDAKTEGPNYAIQMQGFRNEKERMEKRLLFEREVNIDLLKQEPEKIQILKQQKKEMVTTLRIMEDKLIEVNKSCAELTPKLANSSTNFEKMSKEIKEIEERLEVQHAENEALEAVLAKLNVILEEKTNAIMLKEDQLRKIHQKLDKLIMEKKINGNIVEQRSAIFDCTVRPLKREKKGFESIKEKLIIWKKETKKEEKGLERSRLRLEKVGELGQHDTEINNLVEQILPLKGGERMFKKEVERKGERNLNVPGFFQSAVADCVRNTIILMEIETKKLSLVEAEIKKVVAMAEAAKAKSESKSKGVLINVDEILQEMEYMTKIHEELLCKNRNLKEDNTARCQNLVNISHRIIDVIDSVDEFGEVEKKMKKIEKKLGMKKKNGFSAKVLAWDRIAGPIDSYHEWFRIAMTKWLDLAKLKAIKRIKKAVELDEVRVVHSMLKHSASAVDVTCCLGQICAFWNKLEWPDIAGSYVFLTQITDIVASCAMEYADIVLDQLEKESYYEGNANEFDVKEKLCLTMNNLEHVLHFLDSIPDTLNFEALLAELGKEHGEGRLQSLRETLDDVISCAQDDMRQKLDRIIVKTGERMKDEITKYLHDICKNALNEDDPYELAHGVLSYIDHNLVTLNESLLLPAFKRCLIHVWEVFLFSMEDVVRDTSRRDPKVFAILQKVLHIAQDFFQGGGNGIENELISSHTLRSIDRLLSLYASPSAEIIEKYYIEKCEEQAKTDDTLGAINFKIFYSQENKALHVDVLNVRDLLPMDSNQLADPYVQLELVPKHMFKGQAEKRTRVQHETRFAIFDENFSFEVPEETCKKPGATLLLTVYDRDRFHENDIAGEVFVDLYHTLGLEQNISGGFCVLPQIELPLIHGSLIGQPFKVLMERKDALASNFVKLRKEKFKKMGDSLAKSKGRLAQSKK